MPKHWTRRLLVAVTAMALVLAFAGIASAAKYVVLYKAKGVPADGGAVIRSAGGTVVASYAQIGVIIADSSSSTFRAQVLGDARVADVSSTAGFAVQFPDVESATSGATGDLPNAPATDADSFSGLQWDMRQMHVPEAHAITGGSPSVIVGDLDTGLDKDHPDLIPNIDFADSASCIGGAPNQDPAAGRRQRPRHAHCRHDRRGGERRRHRRRRAQRPHRGRQGGRRRRLLLPRGGGLRLHVGRDAPFRRHEQQLLRGSVVLQLPQRLRAAGDLEGGVEGDRVRGAQGVTVVAALGNFDDDLAHPTQDVISPDTGLVSRAGSRKTAWSFRPRFQA